MKMKLAGILVLLMAGMVLAQMEGPRGPVPGGMTPGGGGRPEMGRPGMGEEDDGEPDSMVGRLLSNPKMAERLGLTEDQVKALRTAFYDLKMKQIDVRAALEKSGIEQARLMSEASVDEGAIMKAVEKTGELRTELAKLRIQSMLLLKKTLSPEQVEKIRGLMEERRGDGGMGGRMRMKEGHGEGRGRGRPPEGGPQPEPEMGPMPAPRE